MIFSKSSKRHSFSWFPQSDFPQTIHNQQVVQEVLKSQLQGGSISHQHHMHFFFCVVEPLKKKHVFFFSGRFCGLETFYAVKGFQRGFFPLKVDHPGGFSGYFRMIILEETHFPNIYENDVFHKNAKTYPTPKGNRNGKSSTQKCREPGIY